MKSKRLVELDGLRGIAAISIIVFHYFYRYNLDYKHEIDFPDWFGLGQYGINLFFIVSGFVIYWTISSTENPLDFIWSRFSRLYPTFWFSTTLTFTVVSIFPIPLIEVKVGTFLLNLLMFHEYFGVKHVDGVYWTLSLELAFYFWIFIIFYFGKIKKIEDILIPWIIGAEALTTLNSYTHIFSRSIKGFLLLDYIEFFAAGICFYKYKAKNYNFLTHLTMFLSVLALYPTYYYKEATLLVGIYFVFWMITLNKIPILGNKFLVYFGSISYSLYLVHQNIGYVIIKKFYEFSLSPILGIIVAFSVSVFLAHLITIYIEQPSIKKMRQYYKENKRLQFLRNKLTFSVSNK